MRCKEIKYNKWLSDTRLVYRERIDIIGCTTTGLTKNRGFIAALAPNTSSSKRLLKLARPHVISALYPTALQQLILVGRSSTAGTTMRHPVARSRAV